MQPHVDGLVSRGLRASAIDLPVRRAEAAVEAYRAATLAFPEAREELVIGGQSYGGRVASLLAAEDLLLGELGDAHGRASRAG